MKTLIFDLGETIMYFADINSKGNLANKGNPCTQAVMRVLKDYGYSQVRLEEVSGKLQEFRKQRYETNNEIGPDKLAEYLVSKYHISIEVADKIIDEFSKEFYSSAYLDPFALPVINKLSQRYHLGLLSNSPFGIPSKYTIEAMNRLGIYNLFEFTEFSADIGIRKPSASVFDFVLAKHNLAKSDIIYVGNDLLQDVRAATDYGIGTVVQIKRRDEKSSSGIRLEELPEYLKSMERVGELDG